MKNREGQRGSGQQFQQAGGTKSSVFIGFALMARGSYEERADSAVHTDTCAAGGCLGEASKHPETRAACTQLLVPGQLWEA